MSTATRQVFRELHGVVVSAGLMQNTAKVRIGGRLWNNKIQKYFNRPETHLIHDPNSSLRTGDIVAITPGWRTSKHKRHVLKHIIAPYGTPLEERNPVPTEEERWAAREQKRTAKDARRAERKAAAIEASKLEKDRIEAAKVAEAAAIQAKQAAAKTAGVTTSIEDVD